MSELKEIWKDIEGYGGLYQVSNWGRIRSWINNRNNRRQVPKILKSQKSKKGYLYVNLTINKKQKHHPVHILVAQVFIPNLENKPQVNHINGIKMDNRASNLEWMTNQENVIHAFENGLNPSGENHQNAKLTQKQADEIRKAYIAGNRKFSQRALARKYGVSRGVVRRIIAHHSYKNI